MVIFVDDDPTHCVRLGVTKAQYTAPIVPTQPNIDDTIWKINGFTFATCFDLNRGYYRFFWAKKLYGNVFP